MKINDLKSKRARLLDEMQALIDKAPGRMPASGRAKFDKLKGEAAELAEDIRRADESRDLQLELNKKPAPPIPDGIMHPDGTTSAPVSTTRTTTTGSYRAMYHNVCDTGEFRNFGDFIRAVDTGEIRGMTAGVDSEGGFVVPTGMAADIIDIGLEDAIVRPRAQVYPLQNKGSIKIPAWDGENHSSTLFGGIAAGWTAEATTITDSDPALRQIELDPKKLAALCYVSNELEQDSIGGFSAKLSNAMSQAINFELEHAFWNGVGGGEPLGIANADCVIEVAAEGGQAAATLTAGNVSSMYARLLPSSVNHSAWVVSNTVVPELLQMSLAVGTGGSHWPLLNESIGSFRLFGLPVLISEHLNALGTAGDIWLADFRYYLIAMAQDVRIDRSAHVKFTSDQAAFRVLVRADGAPALDAPVTPRTSGGATLSPFIRLADRT